ncbi:Ethylene-responsive transcription factor [Vigna angularis]|uniref:Ethylene-responsive transcription factor n=1 Tax=Phaseolus angularis TaxID=3914 RepID=A0A8T0KMI6_PHAAN|nr:Ethylene-responsive transcription factor [Vigna angularis]
MDGMQERNSQLGTDIGSSLSKLILTSGSNTLDSIFSDCPPTNAASSNSVLDYLEPFGSSGFEPLGSSVYLRQKDILQKFYQESRGNGNGNGNGSLLPTSLANPLPQFEGPDQAGVRRFRQIERLEELRRCQNAGHMSEESEIGNSISILSGYVDHFQCLESEDAGWGCGWRNIQMLSSHVLVQRPEARKALFGGSGFVPDILSLQRARVVDFGPKESQSIPGSSADNAGNETSVHLVKKKDKGGRGYQVLMDFVWNYFLDENSIQFGQKHVVISEKTPLYFQHDGHSRTIVGIQVNHQQKRHLQYNLLILDPAQKLKGKSTGCNEIRPTIQNSC